MNLKNIIRSIKSLINKNKLNSERLYYKLASKNDISLLLMDDFSYDYDQSNGEIIQTTIDSRKKIYLIIIKLKIFFVEYQ